MRNVAKEGSLRGPLAYVNHGCIATRNCVYKDISAKTLGLKTTANVTKGDEFLVNYGNKFNCECPLCKD